MLSVQCLVQLLKEVKRRAPGFIPTQLQSAQIPVILAHIACLLLNEQVPSGTFGNGCDEVTAYVTLALVTLASPEAELRLIDADILKAIKSASGVMLNQVRKLIPERIWVEKVTYSSDLLTKAYCIAALNQFINHRGRQHEEPSIAHMQLNKLSSMFGSVPLIAQSDCGDILLRVAVQESLPYVAHLEQSRFNIFPKPPQTQREVSSCDSLFLDTLQLSERLSATAICFSGHDRNIPVKLPGRRIRGTPDPAVHSSGSILHTRSDKRANIRRRIGH